MNETIDEEPWVHLEREINFRDWSREDLIAYNQTSRQSEKLRFYRLAFDYLNDAGIKGDYYEFGCHRARTFRMALTEARRQMMDEMRFFAFDSFQGLPEGGEGENPKWTQGALCTDEAEFMGIINEHGIYKNKVHTIPGFYEDTLNKNCKNLLKSLDSNPAFLCIDCDLYSSGRYVFSFIDSMISNGTVIYIDDYFNANIGPEKGLRAAFEVFRNASRFKFDELMNVGWWGKAFIVYD